MTTIRKLLEEQYDMIQRFGTLYPDNSIQEQLSVVLVALGYPAINNKGEKIYSIDIDAKVGGRILTQWFVADCRDIDYSVIPVELLDIPDFVVALREAHKLHLNQKISISLSHLNELREELSRAENAHQHLLDEYVEMNQDEEKA